MELFNYTKATFMVVQNLIIPSALSRYCEPVERYEKDPSIFTRVQYIFSDPINIIDNIYLGNSLNAANLSTLEEFDFDIIINVTDNIPNFFEDRFEYYSINIKDNLYASFGEKLMECSKYIHSNVLQNKKILIHCFEGRSRSVSVLVYYLMNYRNYSFTEAYEHIKQLKNIVNLNKKFVEELNPIKTRSKSLDINRPKYKILRKTKSFTHNLDIMAHSEEYILINKK
jgi:hypothetical protein